MITTAEIFKVVILRSCFGCHVTCLPLRPSSPSGQGPAFIASLPAAREGPPRAGNRVATSEGTRRRLLLSGRRPMGATAAEAVATLPLSLLNGGLIGGTAGRRRSSYPSRISTISSMETMMSFFRAFSMFAHFCA